MPIKNYYLVLGVPQTETFSGIRTAYRDLAKRFHPDLAGDTGTRAFQAVAEAYHVLSDPERRVAHDRALDDERASGRRRDWTVPVGVHQTVEPLTSHPFAEALTSYRTPIEALDMRSRWGIDPLRGLYLKVLLTQR